MVLPNSTGIIAAWRALDSRTEPEGWRSIPVSFSGNCNLQAARRYPENIEALLIGFSSIVLPVASALPQANGFGVERLSIRNSDKWLALVRHPEGGQELFSRMVIDIVDLMSRNAEKSELQLYQLFIGRLHTWQAFMQKSHEALKPSAELGLVGELRFLEILLNAGLPPHMVIDTWKGPIHGLQDFELGAGAVEVKSTLASHGFPAQIMSLEQLDDSVRHPLFVCGCRFSIGSVGMTLPQRVDAIRLMLALDCHALNRFNTVLLFAGYLDVHVEHYVRQFVDTDDRFLLVDSSFPRLVTGNVPVGIRQVHYEIDLDHLVDHKVELAEIMMKTGVIPNGVD